MHISRNLAFSILLFCKHAEIFRRNVEADIRRHLIIIIIHFPLIHPPDTLTLSRGLLTISGYSALIPIHHLLFMTWSIMLLWDNSRTNYTAPIWIINGKHRNVNCEIVKYLCIDGADVTVYSSNTITNEKKWLLCTVFKDILWKANIYPISLILSHFQKQLWLIVARILKKCFFV